MNNYISIIVPAIALLILAGCGGGHKQLLSAEEQYTRARKDYDDKDFIDAVEGFQKVIFNYPGATVVDSAQYFLAMSYYGNEEYELAAVEFRRLTNSYPQSDFVDEASFMTAKSYLENSPDHYALDQEDLKKALTMLEDFIIDNPDSPLVEEAGKSITEGMIKLARKDYENALMYYKIYDYRASEIYFQNVIDNFTNTEYAALSLFKLSEMSYKMKKYDEALTRFNNFISVYADNELVPRASEYVKKINQVLETGSIDEGS